MLESWLSPGLPDEPTALQFVISIKYGIEPAELQELGARVLASAFIQPDLGRVIPLIYDPSSSYLPCTVQVYAVPDTMKVQSAALFQSQLAPRMIAWLRKHRAKLERREGEYVRIWLAVNDSTMELYEIESP